MTFQRNGPSEKNETRIQSNIRSVEWTLSLDVQGYMKEKRVRNDKVDYTLAHAKDGVRHLGDIEEGFVMKNDPFRKEMLISPVVIPIEENLFSTNKWKTWVWSPSNTASFDADHHKRQHQFSKKWNSKNPRTPSPRMNLTKNTLLQDATKNRVGDQPNRGHDPAKMAKKKTKIDVKQAYGKYYSNIFFNRGTIFFSVRLGELNDCNFNVASCWQPPAKKHVQLVWTFCRKQKFHWQYY